MMWSVTSVNTLVSRAKLVEHERQPLLIACVPEGYIGQQERPSAPERLKRREERLRIGSDLLDRHHVEPAKRLGDAKDVAEIPQGGLPGYRAPPRRQPVEGADVPGPDQEVLVLLGGDHVIERVHIRGDLRSDVCGGGSDIEFGTAAPLHRRGCHDACLLRNDATVAAGCQVR
jgi:hypothetical protein